MNKKILLSMLTGLTIAITTLPVTIDAAAVPQPESSLPAEILARISKVEHIYRGKPEKEEARELSKETTVRSAHVSAISNIVGANKCKLVEAMAMVEVEVAVTVSATKNIFLSSALPALPGDRKPIEIHQAGTVQYTHTASALASDMRQLLMQEETEEDIAREKNNLAELAKRSAIAAAERIAYKQAQKQGFATANKLAYQQAEANARAIFAAEYAAEEARVNQEKSALLKLAAAEEAEEAAAALSLRLAAAKEAE